MTPEEYKAKKDLLDRMIKDAKLDINNLNKTPKSLLVKAFYKTMIKELKTWKDIIKEEYAE